MFRRLLPLITAAALLGASVLANAGVSLNLPVHVYRYSNGGSYSEGSLQAARSSSDNVQWIGCYAGISSGYSFVVCSATDSANNGSYCYSSNPTLIAMAGTINESSALSFDTSPYGECTGITVNNVSYALDPN